jgi:hypothetical protein
VVEIILLVLVFLVAIGSLLGLIGLLKRLQHTEQVLTATVLLITQLHPRKLPSEIATFLGSKRRGVHRG